MVECMPVLDPLRTLLYWVEREEIMPFGLEGPNP